MLYPAESIRPELIVKLHHAHAVQSKVSWEAEPFLGVMLQSFPAYHACAVSCMLWEPWVQQVRGCRLASSHCACTKWAKDPWLQPRHSPAGTASTSTLARGSTPWGWRGEGRCQILSPGDNETTPGHVPPCVPPPTGQRGSAQCKNSACIFRADGLTEPCPGPRDAVAGQQVLQQEEVEAEPKAARKTGIAQPSLPERAERRNCVTLMSS